MHKILLITFVLLFAQTSWAQEPPKTDLRDAKSKSAFEKIKAPIRKAFASVKPPRRDPFATNLPREEEIAPTPQSAPQPRARSRTRPQSRPRIQPIRNTGQRTPTAPPTQAIQAPSLNISGIIWNSERPQAIINDNVVDVGDTVSGAEILDIRPDGVEISYDGENGRSTTTVPYKHSGEYEKGTQAVKKKKRPTARGKAMESYKLGPKLYKGSSKR